MCRYPARIASPTAVAVSSGGVWNTPKPIAGSSTPLFRVRVWDHVRRLSLFVRESA